MNINTFKSKLRCSIKLPASKSITNRALILSALSKGNVKLKNILNSRDSILAIDCLQKLGFKITKNSESELEIYGQNGFIPNDKASLFVGNAGTAARFITAICSLKKGGIYHFDSDKEMYKRPMKGLIQALMSQGAKFTFDKEEFSFPFTMQTVGIQGGVIRVDASLSSQILSALMFIMPFAENETRLELQSTTVSAPFIDMSLAMMRQFGFVAKRNGNAFFIDNKKQNKSISEYEIEPDATAASYPISMAAIIDGAILIKDFAKCVLQGDVKYAKILQDANLIKCHKVGSDMLVEKAGRLNKNISLDFNDISDTFISLAAISSLLEKCVTITGIAHTRKQETDRVSAVKTELQKFCKSVEDTNDSITIQALDMRELELKEKPINVETYNDHRIAMGFGVLGAYNINNGEAWVDINNPQTCQKTWPDFFKVLDKCEMDSNKFKVIAIDGGAAVGKSSVSKESANTLGYMHVDTGSHYRTLSYILLENSIMPDDSDDKIASALKNIKISTSIVNNNQARMSVNGELIEDSLIRTERINLAVANFAARPIVREFLKSYQRSMKDEAKKLNFGGIIMEGRDIGSVIFPDADLRIFLDANPETRAARRAKEGICDSIAKRDQLDLNRKTAPLLCPEGAILIDTSYMTKEEVISKSISLIIG